MAHEVGHYAQKLTGTFQKKEAARGRVVQAENNRASVHRSTDMRRKVLAMVIAPPCAACCVFQCKARQSWSVPHGACCFMRAGARSVRAGMGMVKVAV